MLMIRGYIYIGVGGENRFPNLVWAVVLDTFEDSGCHSFVSAGAETVLDQRDVVVASGDFHHLRPREFSWFLVIAGGFMVCL